MPETRKEYSARYIRKHYRENKQYYLDKAKARKIVIFDFIQGQKKKPCVDCGESYPPYVMDFDHVRGDKIINIAWIVRMGWSIKRIAEEIAKCDLVCSNCHRERTHKRLASVV